MTHALQFNFNTVTNAQAVDALVFALSIDLLQQHKIDCAQPACNLLLFNTSAQCMLAQLALSGDSRFSIIRL